MIESAFNKNRQKTIYTLFPKNKKLRISKQNLKYFSKENLDSSDNSNNFNSNNKNNINRKAKIAKEITGIVIAIVNPKIELILIQTITIGTIIIIFII